MKVLIVNRIAKKIFWTIFHGCGSIASWPAQPLRGGGLLFATKSPEIPGTHFIDLGRKNERLS